MTGADLRNLIAAWHHHDRIGREAHESGDHNTSEAATEKAMEVLGAIADAPVLTCDDIALKLAFAAEAFGVTTEERDDSDEAIGGFVRRSLIDARRIIATRLDAN